MKREWYCEYHKTTFTHVCLGCLDAIFHHGLGRVSIIQETIPDETWDETLEFIERLG